MIFWFYFSSKFIHVFKTMNDRLLNSIIAILNVAYIPEIVLEYLTHNRCKSVHLLDRNFPRSFPKSIPWKEYFWTGLVLQDFADNYIWVLMDNHCWCACLDWWFLVTFGRKSVHSKDKSGQLKKLCFTTVLDVQWNHSREKLLRRKELPRRDEYVACVLILTTIGPVHVDLWRKKCRHDRHEKKHVKFSFNGKCQSRLL
jgi:hypothetical protein